LAAASAFVSKPGGGVLELRLELMSIAKQHFCHLRQVSVSAWEPCLPAAW
jgi:hypothetical protein